MELRPITKVLINVFIFLLLVLLSAAQDGSINTTCDAPTVKKGAEGHVICHFPVDLGTVAPPVTVSVELYPFKDKEQVFILECHSIDGIKVICSTAREGYTFNKIFGKDIVVNITAASEDNLGRYVCKSMYTNSPQQQPIPCNFVFEGTTPPTEYGPSTADGDLHVKPEDSSPDVTVIVIACIGVAAVVGGVVICIILYQKRKLTCHQTKRKPGDLEAECKILTSDVTETGEMKGPSITDTVKNRQFGAICPMTTTNSDVTETGEMKGPSISDIVKNRQFGAICPTTTTNSDIAVKDEGPEDRSKGMDFDPHTLKPATSSEVPKGDEMKGPGIFGSAKMYLLQVAYPWKATDSDVTETGETNSPSMTDTAKNRHLQADLARTPTNSDVADKDEGPEDRSKGVESDVYPPKPAASSVTQENTFKSKNPTVKDLVKGFEVKDKAQSTTSSFGAAGGAGGGAAGGAAGDMKRIRPVEDASTARHEDDDEEEEEEEGKEEGKEEKGKEEEEGKEEDDAQNTSEADALIQSSRLTSSPVSQAPPEEEAEDEDLDQPTDQGVTQTVNNSSSSFRYLVSRW